MLQGCGHWTQQERPAEVNAAIVDFSRQLWAGNFVNSFCCDCKFVSEARLWLIARYANAKMRG